MGGAVSLLLAIGDGGDPLAMGMAFALGTIVTAVVITAFALPLWMLLHRRGWRRMRHAALLGAAIGFVAILTAQTHGLGLGQAPPADAATRLYRWISAAATSILPSAVAAAIAMVIWAIAYRPRD